MKKFLLLLLVGLAVFAWRQTGSVMEAKIAGRWRTHVNLNGINANVLLQLYDNQQFDSTFEVAVNERFVTFTGSGTWEVAANSLKVHFAQVSLPTFPKDQPFGGFIKKFEDKKMLLKSKDGEETWYRVGLLQSKSSK